MTLTSFYGRLNNLLLFRTQQILNMTAPLRVLLYKNDYKNDSIIKKDYNIILNIDTVLDTTDNDHEIIIEIVGS